MDNYDYDYEGQDKPAANKSIKGYQIIIIVLAVILVALSLLYYNQMNTIKKEYAVERDTLSNRISMLMDEYDNLRTENDTIARNLGIEKERADSLLQSLSKERNLSRAKIRQYEKELGTLRSVMRNYVHQIDSLNTLNKKLVAEVSDSRAKLTQVTVRAEQAEEKADELTTKIRKGSVIRARDIGIKMMRGDKEVTRANRAQRLRVDFVLSANELSEPGNRPIYVRIVPPSGYILATSAGAVFDYEGEKKTYTAMREVDYQNQDLGVSVYYNGTDITDGKYSVEIYMDGYLIGGSEIVLR